MADMVIPMQPRPMAAMAAILFTQVMEGFMVPLTEDYTVPLMDQDFTVQRMEEDFTVPLMEDLDMAPLTVMEDLDMAPITDTDLVDVDTHGTCGTFF